MKRPILACCFILSFVVATGKQAMTEAAQLKLSIVYQTSYHADFSSTSYSLADGVRLPPGTVAPDDIHQFGLYFELTGTSTSPDESLAGILADIVLGPGLSPSSAVDPYAAITPNPFYNPDPHCPFECGSMLYETNTDGGAQDLQRIVVETDQLAAHGLKPGESGPNQLGYLFVEWDAVAAPVTFLYAGPAASAFADPWALWSRDSFVVGAPEDFFRSMDPAGPTMGFDLIVPEPSSPALFGLGLLGLARLPRRTTIPGTRF